jgi:HAD superfamily hydrolase (TIGR01549 family)
MLIRAMVFDLFDTLVDLHFDATDTTEVAGKRVHSFVARLHEALRERAEVDFETFMEAVSEVDRGEGRPRYKEGREFPTLERFASVARLLGLEDPELPEILTTTHMAGIMAGVKVLPHHDALLDRLGRRVKLGLCSNFSHSATARRVIEEAGLEPHLDAVLISDDVGFRKPRREIFQATLDALGVGAEETLHVGDDLRADVGGAAPLGIRTAWVTRRVRDPEAKLGEWEGPAPDWTVPDLAELEGLEELGA